MIYRLREYQGPFGHARIITGLCLFQADHFQLIIPCITVVAVPCLMKTFQTWVSPGNEHIMWTEEISTIFNIQYVLQLHVLEIESFGNCIVYILPQSFYASVMDASSCSIWTLIKTRNSSICLHMPTFSPTWSEQILEGMPVAFSNYCVRSGIWFSHFCPPILGVCACI